MTDAVEQPRTSAYRPVPLDFERLPEDEMRRRADELVVEMRRRRSVRRFSTDPVPRELIEAAAEVAGTARPRSTGSTRSPRSAPTRSRPT